jgi:hypothetical protein
MAKSCQPEINATGISLKNLRAFACVFEITLRSTFIYRVFTRSPPMCLPRGIFPAELRAPVEDEPFPVRLTKPINPVLR